ncbi:hypothetical protein SAMN05428974_2122 [Sphingopyxis sp. YR583]|uniref:hypothetical protein n=1 Tax=Sphingopyxis sp. YR583 TaxID=1881047 RepID=UPI0008A80EAF|nr:hypothetical protein [Sphingopyxis sp. YR583]SEH17289.1 hypothetical protein SAMN05428974_2122 [Sphingopyxis sp. YR583]
MTNRPMTVSLALLACCAAPLQAQTVNPYQDGGYRGGAGPVATGGFVGARLRIPLGETRSDERRKMRVGLTVAPMQRSDGTGLRGPAWRIGEGLEFGFAEGGATPQLSIGGQRLTGPGAAGLRYAPGGATPAKGRSNMSDAGTVAAVVGGLALLAGIGLLVALDASDDPDRCCE